MSFMLPLELLDPEVRREVERAAVIDGRTFPQLAPALPKLGDRSYLLRIELAERGQPSWPAPSRFAQAKR